MDCCRVATASPFNWSLRTRRNIDQLDIVNKDRRQIVGGVGAQTKSDDGPGRSGGGQIWLRQRLIVCRGVRRLRPVGRVGLVVERADISLRIGYTGARPF